MRRFIAALVLTALAAARGDAQPVPIAPPGPGAAQPVPIAPPGPGARQAPIAPPGPGAKVIPAPAPVPAPIVIPVTSARPPAGYYKSGGVLVGADGYYPFDTGPYLLGGFDGLTRYSGTYYMVSPGASAAPLVEPTPLYAAPSGPTRGRLFHHRR